MERISFNSRILVFLVCYRYTFIVLSRLYVFYEVLSEAQFCDVVMFVMIIIIIIIIIVSLLG